MLNLFYPGRPFSSILHPPPFSTLHHPHPAQLRIMKIQAETFSFNSSGLFSQAGLPRIQPRIQSKGIFQRLQMLNFFECFCCLLLPSPSKSSEPSHWGIYPSNQFYGSPPPNKSTIVLSSPTIFSSSRFSAELSRPWGGCRINSSSLSLSGKRLSLSTDLR